MNTGSAVRHQGDGGGKTSGARIVIANSTLLNYLEGGGHWMIRLQWLLGLKSLGHSPLLMEVVDHRPSTEALDRFFGRLRKWGLEDDAVVCVCSDDGGELEPIEWIGPRSGQIGALIDGADVLWNDCFFLHGGLLQRFKRRVALDLDPGIMQVSALEMDVGLDDHHVLLTVGTILGSPSCQVPLLGRRWIPFFPPIHMALWHVVPPPPDAPVSSVTHWTWNEMSFQGVRLSKSKREGYQPYLQLPALTRTRLELAVGFLPDDTTGERERLVECGWNLVDPWIVVSDPEGYRRYIENSLAELSCVKPIFRALRTGWFSDRSACYLAAGRPVIAEDTGFSDALPTGRGLLTFSNLDEALAGIEEITGNWAEHSRAARELAAEYFDGRRVLAAMVEASLSG